MKQLYCSFLKNETLTSCFIDGIRYPSASYAYLAAKLLQVDLKKKIAIAKTLVEARKIVQENQIRKDWRDICDDETLKILRAKYTGPFLPNVLKELNDDDIIETCGKWLGKLTLIVKHELEERSKNNDLE